MMTIKAIETVYKGYRFRSRLEARWAVFFDALKIRFEYELEGFDLHYNGKYLPDFYLPTFKAYLEIKPFPEDMRGQPKWWNREAHKKARELSMALKDTWTIITFGDPLDHRACWFWDGTAEFPDAAIEFDSPPGQLSPTFWEGQVISEWSDSSPLKYVHREAGIIARQARFEHGQNGAG